MPRASQSTTRRDLRAIFLEGVSFSVMVGAGETYVPAFALAIGVKAVWAGLLVTVPLLAGGALQLVSPIGVSRLGSRKTWVTTCAAVQGLAFIPLVVAAIVGHAPTALLFLITSIYWGAGLAAGPPWNAWVGTIVPRRVRTRYFARRNAACHVGVFVGVLAGGLLLERCAAHGRTLLGFVVLFAIAGVSRLLSAHFLAQQSEPSPPVGGEQRVPLGRLWRHLWRAPDARLLRYLVGLAFAVSIAVPFFTPYMLQELHLRYSTYMTLIATALGAKILVMARAGRLAERWGAGRVARIAAAGIVPMSACWLVSNELPFLLGLQMVSGAFWASHDLATFLLLFETIREDERTSVLTFYNFASSLATVCGSLLGGAIFEARGSGPEAYRTVFLGSSCVRALALLLLIGVSVATLPPVRVLFRTIAVRPDFGSISRPIAATVRRARRAGKGS